MKLDEEEFKKSLLGIQKARLSSRKTAKQGIKKVNGNPILILCA